MLDFVEELSFVRTAGSEEEKKAAELIMDKIRGIAENKEIQAEYMTFRIPDAKVGRCSVQAAGRELPCVPYLRSGNIDRSVNWFIWMELQRLISREQGAWRARQCC